MKVKSSSSVGIIGGADGPTSVFVAGSHTLEEVVAYADEKYHLIEVTKTGRKYVEQRKRFKESLVSKHKTELLGDLMPMDFHRLPLECFWISYSGSKKTIKRMKGIAKDLYLYYGVSEEDIQKKSERYHSLLATLST